MDKNAANAGVISANASQVAVRVIHTDEELMIARSVCRATLRNMHQNLWWATGYNIIAFPNAAGLFYPAIGLILRPEIAVLSMPGSSLLVALNTLMLKNTRLKGIKARDSVVK